MARQKLTTLRSILRNLQWIAFLSMLVAILSLAVGLGVVGYVLGMTEGAEEWRWKYNTIKAEYERLEFETKAREKKLNERERIAASRNADRVSGARDTANRNGSRQSTGTGRKDSIHSPK